MVIDSDPLDFDDTVEYVSHSSNQFGVLTKDQQRKAFAALGGHQPITMDMENASRSEIIENMACIYKYVYPNLKKKKDVEQIGLGIITKVYGDPSSEDAAVDIRFCPPHGAKPQTLSRPDTLYQNIAVLMQFNLKYLLNKKGAAPKPEMEVQQPRSVLLAWNLDVNKKGLLSTQACIGSEANGTSSKQFADRVIKCYYNTRKK